MTSLKLNSHLILLLILLIHHQVGRHEAFVYMDPNDEAYVLPCVVDANTQIHELGDDCGILKFFNQSQVDVLNSRNELNQLAKHCACQLANMWQERWTDSYDDDFSTRRLSYIVMHTILPDNKTVPKYPPYLWSDMDVVASRISIYTATHDYFERAKHNRSLSLASDLKNHEIYKLIRRVCRKVSADPAKLYRYLENVNRVSPDVFMRLVSFMEAIEIVYQASKACKTLVMLHINEFQLRPDSDEIVPVDSSNAPLQYVLNSENSVDNDIDSMLKGASALLMNCNFWQRHQSSIQDLTRECPMMVSDKVPTNWIMDHPSLIERSKTAIKCACQLLLHKSAWEKIMQDRNVALMSKALTNYMNRQQLPHFASAPIWTIHGWFQEVMSKFSNRKMSIKEMVKTILNNQDPFEVINKDTDSHALELLRRGCNFIVFNYNKGSKEASELKLIQYLDNLQLISQDPLFVFHLTLQDVNLFKLHALSKMCLPIVK